ncbi:winged helix-turn-helix transcriptional regulator [Emticicia sp. CRIBPO]|jgi:Lrp/AsnC family leucine-responsive transcriptional regulator|uniref:Lrp/AsnC family transcriptional regulator n=1 Tax=Emticicia sp. CRIBPO TaxID=2683258 RepID=UPI001411B8CB|nr:Lrp/AsnC family transcriptional regulator [Emticicia sp. CRIBPO]NBA86299.1 winged helix-turn-helix transcriptional regulator [Emticicia sp. CRIBPO]
MNGVDPVDLKILKLLQKDGLMTNKEIAAELNLTTTPVHERIKRLRRDGYINKYTIDLNKKKLNKNLTVFCNVSLKEHAQEFLTKFEQDVQTVPEIVECYCISGGSDFLLKVIVADIDEYRHFILNKLAALSNIGNAQSHFVVTEVKQSTIIP